MSSGVGYLLLVVATAVHLGSGIATITLLGPFLTTPLDAGQIVGSAILVALMFSLHGLAFRQWERAGYRLRLGD
jgi:hypothetical protein